MKTRTHPIRIVFAALALAGLGTLTGCQDHVTITSPPVDNCGPTPLAPVDLYSVTGDQWVLVLWTPIEPRLTDYFVVYRSNSPDGPFTEVGETTDDTFTDTHVVNGVTYFYAVSAVGACGTESALSRELAYDTPRPEGSASLFDADGPDWQRGAWDFSTYRAVPADAPGADMAYVMADGVGYLVATDLNTDIQDAGTGDFDAVSWAPDGGWSPTGTVEVIPGHNYIVWTRDNHYAKVRVLGQVGDRVDFDWGYQIDTGNPELKPGTRTLESPLL